jgi:hypothetical protein
MPRLHDAAFRDSVKKRISALTPEAKPRWGRMSVDQMLWHVNSALATSLGKMPYEPEKRLPLPGPVARFLVLRGPWPKGNTPTLPQFVAKSNYDFAAEQKRCLQLIDEFAATPVEKLAADHPRLGPCSGDYVTRLQGRHFAHHLEQFS